MLSAALITPNIKFYPEPPPQLPPCTYGDLFTREAVTPANGYTLYTTALGGTGGGSAALTAGRLLTLVTDPTAIGDDVDVRTSGFAQKRAPHYSGIIPAGRSVQYDVIFSLNETTDTEGFVGVLAAGAGAISALPTTAKHAGLFWDKSAQANFRLTSANGTTQVNTDSTQVLATDQFRLRVIWNGNNAGSITLFSTGPAFTTQMATVAVTALGNTDTDSFALHFFVQNEATAAKTLNVREWYVSYT